MFVECEIRLGWIDDFGPGIDSCFDRIGLNQRLGEPVNRAANELIERLFCPPKIGFLFDGDAFGKGDFELAGDFAFRQLADEAGDADHQFACGEFGESDGGDAFGLDAFREKHGHAAGHDRGLAGAGSGFHKQGPFEFGQGSDPRRLIGGPFGRHQSASQIFAASPSFSSANAILRGR